MDPASLPADAVGPPADLWRRAVARLADLSTVFFAMWALVLLRVLWFVPSYSDDLQPEPWGRYFTAVVTLVVLHLAFEAAFLRWNKGQTPGRDWMKVRVVAANGLDPTLALALRRSVLPALAVLATPLWWVLAPVVALLGGPALVGPRRRSLLDRLAGTTVVAYDRDLHEPPDPRAQRRRPRALRMWAGMSRNPDREDDWVVSGQEPPGTTEQHRPTRRTPALSGHGKRRAQ